MTISLRRALLLLLIGGAVFVFLVAQDDRVALLFILGYLLLFPVLGLIKGAFGGVTITFACWGLFFLIIGTYSFWRDVVIIMATVGVLLCCSRRFRQWFAQPW